MSTAGKPAVIIQLEPGYAPRVFTATGIDEQDPALPALFARATVMLTADLAQAKRP